MANDETTHTHASDVAPLTPDERAELEALRAEKVARERSELESLRKEQQRAAARTAKARQANDVLGGSRRELGHDGTASSNEEVRRIAAARARGKELMQPDEDTLAMPPGQKLVLVVLAIAVLVALIMMFAPLG